MAIIHLDLELLQGSSDQPENGSGLRQSLLFGLAADGVCPALNVAAQAVGSYPAVSPLPVRESRNHAIGGLFSVALSVTFGFPYSARPLAVILPCAARTFLSLTKK